MIRLSLGNVGSGKTASEVREMVTNPLKRLTFTNIKVYGDGVEHIRLLTPDMIINKRVVRTIHKKDGSNEDVEEYTVNVDFWKSIKEPINIVLDEAHTILNSRAFMTKKNRIVNHWLSLIRRVLGDTESGNSEIVFISQLSRKLDTNLREMSHNIRWHVCHYIKECQNCRFSWSESSDMPEIIFRCPRCGNVRVVKKNHRIQIKYFADINKFNLFKDFGERTFYKENLILDVSNYFHNYRTLEWDGLFNEY